MISEFIRKADLCKKSIDALRPLEGQMLKQVKAFTELQPPGRQMHSKETR